MDGNSNIELLDSQEDSSIMQHELIEKTLDKTIEQIPEDENENLTQ